MKPIYTFAIGKQVGRVLYDERPGWYLTEVTDDLGVRIRNIFVTLEEAKNHVRDAVHALAKETD